ncbi:hypothetical protein P43SY_011447 [Pythium insidiosum]|uniref:Crinkler (CRN) family protein n=1 Tax=Pythium insidiosum TaxID=114742 RepID=A0AAD5M542_PYTIN|nr:hypothetical protein P43SY_011447 [Pythium insidiosum]
MPRKWFQLVGEDGNALTSADAVVVDIEDVDTLRDAVKLKFADSDLAGIAPSNLTVFANLAAYEAKQAFPRSSSPVTGLGIDEDNAIIVQVPQKADSALGKFFLGYVHFLGYVASSVSFATSLITSGTSQSPNIPAAKKKV